jgi:ferredoxin
MDVWIDQDLCTGDGLCTDHCPDVFVLLEDGISYVRDAAAAVVEHDPGGRSSMVHVARRFEQAVIDAAEACPGECIFVEATVVAADPHLVRPVAPV